MRTKKNKAKSNAQPLAQVLWDSKMLSSALGTNVGAGIEATGVSIDSRTIEPGQIFLAIKGESLDGNDYAKDALGKGAVLCIVSRVDDKLKKYQDKLVEVSNTQDALNKLAVYARSRLKGKVVGITGSVGKTSTKEMLRIALEDQGKIYVSQGNFNNHYGLPLCLANMPEDTDYAVLEMGMSSVGEIAHLARMAKPDVAIITTVEAVHLEYFNSVSAIAAAKAEIFEGMRKGDTAIINFENPYHQIILGFARDSELNVLSFGKEQKTSFKLESYEVNAGKAHIKAECMGRDIDYTLGATGIHLALNSLAVLAAVYAIGAELAYAARCLSKFKAQKGRGLVHKLTERKLIVIDDCYNAAPASVRAAIANLATYKTGKNRLVAVLGNMLELGAKSPEMHSELVHDIINHGIDRVYTVGSLMQHLHEKLPPDVAAGHADNSNAIAKIVANEIKAGDVILIKGSNSMKMATVVDRILEK